MRMKKRLSLIAVVTVLLISSCGQENTSSISSEPTSRVSSQLVESELSSEFEEINEESGVVENTEMGGSVDACAEHIYTYHSVDSSLVDYVGQNEVHEWYNAISAKDEYNRVNEDSSILSFIQEFDIPKSTFIEVTRNSITDTLLDALEITYDEYLIKYGYTDEQIDALYSGDQAEINRVFCGDMAYYNEEDGQLYSIYWLSDHTAEDCAEAELPVEEVQRILELAQSAGSIYAMLAEEATSTVEEFAYMEENIAE